MERGAWFWLHLPLAPPGSFTISANSAHDAKTFAEMTWVAISHPQVETRGMSPAALACQFGRAPQPADAGRDFAAGRSA